MKYVVEFPSPYGVTVIKSYKHTGVAEAFRR